MKQIEAGNIYLLQETNEHTLVKTNALKLFTKAVYALNKIRNVNFSYSNGNGSLHNHLTIFEILKLESLPLALNGNRVIKSDDFVKTIENPYLKKIIQRICPLDRSISNMTKEELKLASLSKALISNEPYLFLDGPDNWLSSTNIKLVKDCLNFEIKNNNKIIFIKTTKTNIWLDTVHYFIEANKREFKLSQNLLVTPSTSNQNIKPNLKIVA